jgi:hypothetical protein
MRIPTDRQLLEAAVLYAFQGIPVLPLHGKVPLLGHGLHDASNDPTQVVEWWMRWPRANIGLRTGIVFDACDVDDHDTFEILNSIEHLVAPTVQTGKGYHLWVQPTGHGNTTNPTLKIDWRGRNGYVVAPPSIHPATGEPYQWTEFAMDNIQLPPAPSWLLGVMFPPKPKRIHVPTYQDQRSGESAGDAALRRAHEAVANAPAGSRNDTLNAATYGLRRYIDRAALTYEQAIDVMRTAGLASGLGAREIDRTIASALGLGRYA